MHAGLIRSVAFPSAVAGRSRRSRADHRQAQHEHKRCGAHARWRGPPRGLASPVPPAANRNRRGATAHHPLSTHEHWTTAVDGAASVPPARRSTEGEGGRCPHLSAQTPSARWQCARDRDEICMLAACAKKNEFWGRFARRHTRSIAATLTWARGAGGCTTDTQILEPDLARENANASSCRQKRCNRHTYGGGGWVGERAAEGLPEGFCGETAQRKVVKPSVRAARVQRVQGCTHSPLMQLAATLPLRAGCAPLSTASPLASSGTLSRVTADGRLSSPPRWRNPQAWYSPAHSGKARLHAL